MLYPVINMSASGSAIRAAIKNSGSTAKDVAEFMGFSAPQAVYKWMNGQSMPTVDNLFALSVFLGVPMESLIVGQNALRFRPGDPEAA